MSFPNPTPPAGSGHVTDFHLFPLLPLEIRLNIWSYAAPLKQSILARPGRFHDSHGMSWNTYILVPLHSHNQSVHPVVPPLLHTCRESRLEMLDIGRCQEHIIYKTFDVTGPNKRKKRVCMSFDIKKEDVVFGMSQHGSWLYKELENFRRSAMTGLEKNYRVSWSYLRKQVPLRRIGNQRRLARSFGSVEAANLAAAQRRARMGSPEEGVVKSWFGMEKKEYENWRAMELKFVPWKMERLYFPKRRQRKEGKIVGKEVVIMLGSEEQRRGRDERAEARRLRG